MPKSAPFQKIEVLFPRDHIAPLQFPQHRPHRLGKLLLLHVGDVGLGQILQLMSRRVFDELVEVNRLVGGAEIVVKETGIGVFEGSFQFLPHHAMVEVGLGFGFGEKLEQGSSLADLLFGALEVGHVIVHHAPRQVAEVVPGIGIVADVRDALFGQMRCAKAQELVADRGRHPRVKAVGDDVIEPPKIRRRLQEIELLEGNVRKSERADQFLALCDGALRQVEADKLAGGKTERHRHQVAAVAASQFEHPAALHGSRAHAKQRRQGGQPIRMGLRIEGAGIKKFVVTIAHWTVHDFVYRMGATAQNQITLDNWKKFRNDRPAST